MSIIEEVRAHLDDGGVIDGHSVLYYRWSDKTTAPLPWVVIAPEQGISGDYLVQNPGCVIYVVGEQYGVVSADETARNIAAYLREFYQFGSVIHADVIASPHRPMWLEDERPVFQINLVCKVAERASVV